MVSSTSSALHSNPCMYQSRQEHSHPVPECMYKAIDVQDQRRTLVFVVPHVLSECLVVLRARSSLATKKNVSNKLAMMSWKIRKYLNTAYITDLNMCTQVNQTN